LALPFLVVTFRADNNARTIIAAALDGAGDPVYLQDVDAAGRAAALREAGVVLAFNTSAELAQNELPLIANARLLQFVTAGVDHLPLRALSPRLPVAVNAGAYSEPMAEHALAMILAAAKRLLVEHRNLQRGQFNQIAPNRLLKGSVCGIFGYGGIGTAVARLMRAMGMRIHAINRRGIGDDVASWIGTPDRIDDLLKASDVLVISAPLTQTTERRIGARELGLMKRGAILVNVGRGAIIDEAALFDHLRRNPQFTACIDAWWVEPPRNEPFKPRFPFLELPNVIGSPHNSAMIPGIQQFALKRAVENCRSALSGGQPLHIIGDDERMR
jgi:phosphoglycerate dehydrogenase-like enzyme